MHCALCIVHCACRFFLKVDHLRNLMAIQLVFVWQLCYQLKWWSTRWKSIIHKITRLQTVSKPSAQPEWQSCLCTKPSSKGNANGNYVCACDCQFSERSQWQWQRQWQRHLCVCMRLPSHRASQADGLLLPNPGKAVGGSFYRFVRSFFSVYISPI